MQYWQEPLDNEYLEIPRGRIRILRERCKGCSFCVEYCPCGVLEVSEEFNAKGYHLPCVKDEEACVNCGLCEILCPEFAIYLIE